MIIEKIVDLVFTEMIHDKMQQLEKEELAKQDQTDGNQWSTSQYSEWTTQRCNMSPYVYAVYWLPPASSAFPLARKCN